VKPIIFCDARLGLQSHGLHMKEVRHDIAHEMSHWQANSLIYIHLMIKSLQNTTTGESK